MIHNVMLLVEQVFCGKPVVEDKIKSSNHSIWQILICLKENLGKKAPKYLEGQHSRSSGQLRIGL